ncbi:LysR family transcriptional regulator [Janthinobacterium sp.]|uniref:LysR family transcriptional regulator n=1 Tax=Janthinobacterium sp. TaxID=1871054 RepID=UPI00293D63FE|nr:LysR family transcriptional regulator [Janthinobacterium sp.]
MRKFKVWHKLFMALITAELRQLRAFAVVAAELNFLRAAERLHLSQPALSQSIKQLELHLSLQLFYRDTRSVQLTAAGALILDDVLELLNRYELFLNRTRDIARGRRGTLKVGYLIGAGVDLVPSIIRAFSTQFPDVNIVLKEFDFASPEAGIRSGMDVAILRPPIEDDSVELVTLLEEACVACVPDGHRLAQLTTVSVYDLLDEPIVAAPGNGVWRDYWLATTYRKNESPNIVYEAPTFESEFQAVASGKGISITPIAASRFYARPGLAFPNISDMPPCVVSIALPKRASPLAREFSQVAIALAQSYQSQAPRDAKSSSDNIT